jgi:hypothetical protein
MGHTLNALFISAKMQICEYYQKESQHEIKCFEGRWHWTIERKEFAENNCQTNMSRGLRPLMLSFCSAKLFVFKNQNIKITLSPRHSPVQNDFFHLYLF